jgi:flagellar secretion chaperone FliS
MTPPNAARSAYLDASVATASPARLLVMLCERLARDVRSATDAQEAGDHPAAHPHFLHAQDIVLELRSSLRTDLWSDAKAVDSLYEYLYTRLVQANARRDAEAGRECLDLTTQIADTWREAALASVMSP